VRASRSRSIVRVRASAQEVIGGERGMVCFAPEREEMVKEEKVMSRRVGEEASEGETWQKCWR